MVEAGALWFIDAQTSFQVPILWVRMARFRDVEWVRYWETNRAISVWSEFEDFARRSFRREKERSRGKCDQGFWDG